MRYPQDKYLDDLFDPNSGKCFRGGVSAGQGGRSSAIAERIGRSLEPVASCWREPDQKSSVNRLLRCRLLNTSCVP